MRFLSDKYEHTEGQKRMLALADMVEKLDQSEFDMNQFHTQHHYGNTCGTMGCVMGWGIANAILDADAMGLTTYYDKCMAWEQPNQKTFIGSLRGKGSYTSFTWNNPSAAVLEYLDIESIADFIQLFGSQQMLLAAYLKTHGGFPHREYETFAFTREQKAAQIRQYVKAQVEQRIEAHVPV